MSFADDDHDPAVEAALRSHLRDTLDPHLGRARGAVERAVAGRPSPRHGRRWTIGLAAGTAAAAATAIALALRPAPVVAPPAVRRVPPAAVEPAAAPVSVVEQDARWQTIDGGVVRLGDGSAARLLWQRRLDRVRYYDPDRHATIEYTVPREQTVYVGLTSF